MVKLAYLFERFPSFTQTFCAREVRALRQLGFAGPVFSVRNPCSEPVKQRCQGLGEVVYLPESFGEILASDAIFRREARKGQGEMRRLWGDESEKHRIYESLWLERECADRGVHHLHAHFAGIAARAAYWLRQRGGPAYSLTVHANDVFCDDPSAHLPEVLGAAAFVVAVSDFGKRDLETRFPALEGRVHRVYNGIESASVSPATFPDGPPLILSVGRAIEKKGFADLVAACGLLGGRAFECRIVGGGPLEGALRAQAEAAGLGDRVFVEGALDEASIGALLARARVFALPCVVAGDGGMDNLPTVIMEAMAAGLPVVSTAIAGVPEMVEDGLTGRLVPEHSPEQLAAAIAGFLDDAGLARACGAAGRARCLERFDTAATAPRLADLFRASGVWQ